MTKSVEQVYVILEHPDEEISKYQRKFELFQVSDIDHVMDLWINMSADNALEIIAIEAGITLESVRNLVIYDLEEYKFTKASLDLIKIWGYDFNEFTKISEDKGTMAAFEYLIENRRDFGLFRNVLYVRIIHTESRQMEYQMNENNFLISLAWTEEGIDVGDSMLKLEKCCEGSVHATEIRKFISFIGYSIYRDSVCITHIHVLFL